MSIHPDMILQYAHRLGRDLGEIFNTPVEVRAEVKVGLNGRNRQYLVDPSLDLTQVEPNVWEKSWVVPLTEPFVPIGK